MRPSLSLHTEIVEIDANDVRLGAEAKNDGTGVDN